MARISIAVTKLSGTLGDITFVRSKNGDYVRKKRGSSKDAVCNSVLQKNNSRTGLLNQTAQPIFQLLKMYADGFRDSNLWQSILSRFRKSSSDELIDLLATLQGLELRARYSLAAYVAWNKNLLHFKQCSIDLHFNLMQIESPPCKDEVTQFRFQFILFYLHDEMEIWQHDGVYTDWINIQGSRENRLHFSCSFPRPDGLGTAVLVIRVEWGADNQCSMYMGMSRMQVAEVRRG